MTLHLIRGGDDITDCHNSCPEMFLLMEFLKLYVKHGDEKYIFYVLHTELRIPENSHQVPGLLSNYGLSN